MSDGGRWTEYEPPERYKHKETTIGRKWTVKRGDIPNLFTDEFWEAYRLWENWKVLGVLPHGKGWLAENPWTIKIIKSFEKEYQEAMAEAEDRERRKINGNNNRKVSTPISSRGRSRK